jgi:SET domain-containing protein
VHPIIVPRCTPITVRLQHRTHARANTPQLVRRGSSIAGWGVFTTSPISKNTRVAEYTGERISHAASARRERRQLKAGRIWCFTVNNRVVVDASVDGSIARYINHSCRPNCYARVVDGRIWICAARNIRRGEELTYDYHTKGEARIQCRCRSGCERML